MVAKASAVNYKADRLILPHDYHMLNETNKTLELYCSETDNAFMIGFTGAGGTITVPPNGYY